ncbi:hypothetical protein KDK95_17930 [Actinospica sp. MGRD01-02]|uniref:Uncharacterized protein n=1 Tax=Actinospica acidithermotolerans TaxID=2828514 RepID=A0A941ED05_9ACTN|nr:hypothetical protein [Actinospica acidithermotolerans]MBR7828198.1 hypothetical protein [Actinospica acidithermotolerans]
MGVRGPLLNWELPWRPPDLPRFARTAQFRDLHAAAEGWIEDQFESIGGGGALVPAARLVSDFGALTGTNSRRQRDIGILRIRSGVFATMSFQRQVAVAYGLDGPVGDRVLDLVKALESAGWNLSLHNSRHAIDPGPISAIRDPVGAASGGWHGFGGPPHLRQPAADPTGSANCLIRVVWTSRTEQSPIVVDVVRPAHPEIRTPSAYLPLEMNGPVPPVDIRAFAAPAFEWHESAVAVLIEVFYYRILPGATRPRDVPRRFALKL